MIIEDYVSFDTAKLLKERGFDGKCNAYYDCFTISNFHDGYEPTDFNSIDTKVRNIISAPTLQMAMKWLRKHGWVICVIPLSFYCGEVVSEWGYNIWADDNLEIDEDNTPRFKSYEETCESAIRYCLENLI